MNTFCTYALFLVFLMGCIGGKQTELQFQANEIGVDTSTPLPVGVTREQSIKAFEKTVYPIVRSKTCVNCHNSATAGQQPVFADAGLEKAYDAITMTKKVDLVHPEDSRLVSKVKEVHNCWTADCNANSQELLEAIKEWAKLAPQAGSSALVTAAINYPADVSLTQTEHGTLILQAEQSHWPTIFAQGTNVLQEGKDGRFTEHQDSLAGDGKYLEFSPADPHPRQARRTLQIDATKYNNCAEFSDANDVNNPATRAIRIIQQKVHNPSGTILSGSNVVQDGHIPKIARLQFNVIRPDKRLEYAKMMVTNDYTGVNGLLLTDGLEAQVNRVAGAALGSMNGSSVLVGSQSFLLPKFARHSDVFDASGNFRPGNNLYNVFETTFAESRESIRANLAQASFNDIKKFIMYKDLKSYLSSIYYNQSSPRTSPTIRYGEYLNGDVETLMSRDVSVQYVCPSGTCTPDQLKFAFNSSGPVLTQSNALDCYTISGNQFVSVGASNCTSGNPQYFHLIDAYVYISVDQPALTQRSVNVYSASTSASTHVDVETYSQLRTEIFLNDLANQEENPNFVFISGAAAVSDIDSMNNFQNTTYPILRASCVNCHGSAAPPAGAPQFASASATNSYQILKAGGYINFADPQSSFRNDLLAHCNARGVANCGAVVPAIHSSILAWNNANAAVAVANGAEKFKNLSREERLPGRLKFNFKVTEAGKYNIWARLKNTINAAQRINFRILSANGAPVNYSVGTAAPGGSSCYNWTANTTADLWDWSTPGRQNELSSVDAKGYILYDNNKNPLPLANNRIYFNLSPGDYTLDIIGLTEGMKIDQVAINKVADITKWQDRLEFQPDRRAGDFKHVADYKRRVLRYDLSSALKLPSGKSAYFEIEVKKEFDNQNYIFRNPRFIAEPLGAFNISIKGIKVLINGKWSYPDATYNNLEAVVGDNRVITYAPLVALIGGPGDVISFQFEKLEVTNDPLSTLYPKGSPPAQIAAKHCNDLDYFIKNVKPILQNVKVMLNSEMNQFVTGFPGNPRQGFREAQAYNCITCHTVNHPYFKMSTFLNDDEFCREALSRVDFDNHYQSLVIRGINGTGNHPKFVFVEKFIKDSSGNFKVHNMGSDFQNNRYVADPNNLQIASEILAGPQLKWTYNEIVTHPSYAGLTSAQQATARSRAGMLKRISARKIDMNVVNYSWFIPEKDLPLLYAQNNPNQLDNNLGAYDVILANNGDIDDQRRGPLIYDILGFVNNVPSTSVLGDRNGTVPLKGNTKIYRMNAEAGFDPATIDYDSTTPAQDPASTWTAQQEALRDYYRETVMEWIRREDALR